MTSASGFVILQGDYRLPTATAMETTTSTLDLFHPAVGAWLSGRFGAPTEPRRQAWPSIRAGRHTLIAAPTGSGKTLAAIDDCRAPRQT